MAEMKVNLCGITLDNPVMAASGTFGYGYEFAELYDINRLGTFSFRGNYRQAAVRQPYAEDSRMYGRHDKLSGTPEPGSG